MLSKILKYSPHNVLHRARWIVPVTSPIIEDGAVAAAKGVIIAVGRARDMLRYFSGRVYDHGDSVIMPAFVNAHSHLELSFARGQMPQKSGFARWLETMVNVIEQNAGQQNMPRKKEALMNAVAEFEHNLTAATGDICNTMLVPEAVSDGRFRAVYGVFFREIICPGPPDFEEDDLESFINLALHREHRPVQGLHPVRFSVAAHAPYSTSPEAMLSIKRTCNRHSLPFSIHVAESLEETEYMRHGRGALCEFLSRKRGRDAGEMSPGITSIRLLEKLKMLDRKTICVHCVHPDMEEISILARTRSNVCLCPGSNHFMGTGVPPVRNLFEAGINITLGTDSHASNIRLSIPYEMALTAEMAPDIPPETIFQFATINGARALGLDNFLGSLEPGKTSRFAVHSVDVKDRKELMEHIVYRIQEDTAETC